MECAREMIALQGDDHHIDELKRIIDEMVKEGLTVKNRQCPRAFKATGNLKANDRDTFINAANMLVELGHPATVSICLGLITERDDLVHENRITILGKNLGALSPGRHPLAFIVLAKVLEAGEGTRQALFRNILSINLLSGVMARMSSGRIWLRFSREAVSQGLTLETIGMHFLSELKKERNRFEQVEVIFIVAGQDSVKRLGSLAERIAEERRSRYNTALVERMECETGLDCDECPESETCKVLKDAIAVARKRNENR